MIGQSDAPTAAVPARAVQGATSDAVAAIGGLSSTIQQISASATTIAAAAGQAGPLRGAVERFVAGVRAA